MTARQTKNGLKTRCQAVPRLGFSVFPARAPAELDLLLRALDGQATPAEIARLLTDNLG